MYQIHVCIVELLKSVLHNNDYNIFAHNASDQWSWIESL